MQQRAPQQPREIHGHKRPLQRESSRAGVVFRPDVDIVERTDAFVVTADLPGVDDGHVEVRLDRGVLSIHAEQAFAPDPSWHPVHAEYRAGGFHREFTLSDGIELGKIRAVLRDGVLELVLPKAGERQPRTIPVEGGS